MDFMGMCREIITVLASGAFCAVAVYLGVRWHSGRAISKLQAQMEQQHQDTIVVSHMINGSPDETRMFMNPVEPGDTDAE